MSPGAQNPDAGLTHFDAQGRPRMVDVGAKPETRRVATAEGWLRVAPETLAALQGGQAPKGDPLIVARVAGIQAAKRTATLIPLCHPLRIDSIDVELRTDAAQHGVRAVATVSVAARTGVEMEALTAVGVALLTLYDMLKAIDRGMRIDGIRLLHKSGGRSGTFDAEGSPSQAMENE